MQSARGAVLLFADADGATKFADLSKLEARLKELVKGILSNVAVKLILSYEVEYIKKL